MDEMRRQIQELMSSVETEKDERSRKNFTDPSVCKHYLCGLCPHDLFQNTKLYMGQCKNLHSDEFREEYLKAREKRSFGYEEQSMHYIKPLVDECDRKIAKQVKERCESQEKLAMSVQNATLKEVVQIDAQIKELTKEAEELGNKGSVDESLRLMEEIQRMTARKRSLEEGKPERIEEAKSMWFQKLKPCEVCGALLSEKDGENRLNEHFLGRIHIGFDQIRKHIKSLQDYLAKSRTRRSTSRTSGPGGTGDSDGDAENRNEERRRSFGRGPPPGGSPRSSHGRGDDGESGGGGRYNRRMGDGRYQGPVGRQTDRRYNGNNGDNYDYGGRDRRGYGGVRYRDEGYGGGYQGRRNNEYYSGRRPQPQGGGRRYGDDYYYNNRDGKRRMVRDRYEGTSGGRYRRQDTKSPTHGPRRHDARYDYDDYNAKDGSKRHARSPTRSESPVHRGKHRDSAFGATGAENDDENDDDEERAGSKTRVRRRHTVRSRSRSDSESRRSRAQRDMSEKTKVRTPGVAVGEEGRLVDGADTEERAGAESPTRSRAVPGGPSPPPPPHNKRGRGGATSRSGSASGESETPRSKYAGGKRARRASSKSRSVASRGSKDSFSSESRKGRKKRGGSNRRDGDSEERRRGRDEAHTHGGSDELKDRESREKERDRRRNRDRDREKDGDRDRDKERNRDRDRDRERDRDRDRDRDRERDRGRGKDGERDTRSAERRGWEKGEGAVVEERSSAGRDTRHHDQHHHHHHRHHHNQNHNHHHQFSYTSRNQSGSGSGSLSVEAVDSRNRNPRFRGAQVAGAELLSDSGRRVEAAAASAAGRANATRGSTAEHVSSESEEGEILATRSSDEGGHAKSKKSEREPNEEVAEKKNGKEEESEREKGKDSEEQPPRAEVSAEKSTGKIDSNLVNELKIDNASAAEN